MQNANLKYEIKPEHDAKIMLVESFKAQVEAGTLTDEHGFAVPVKNMLEADCHVFASEIKDLPDDATHIAWYTV